MKRKIKVFLLYCMIFVNIIPMTVNAKEKHSDIEYKVYNITVKNKNYYYKGKRIRIFQDIKRDKSFVRSFVDNKGSIDIRILRNDKDKIKRVKKISKKKANEILKEME